MIFSNCTLVKNLTPKYLGHYITDDLSDDDDINRQRGTLFVFKGILYCESLICVPWV